MLFMLFGSVFYMLFWLIIPLLLVLVPLFIRLFLRRRNKQNDIDTRASYHQGEFIESEFVDDEQDSQK